MSTTPLRTLGIELDVTSDKAISELAKWEQEIKESLGFAEDFVASVDDMSAGMLTYANDLGISTDKLRELKEGIRADKEMEIFSQATGISASEIKRLAEEAENANNNLLLLDSVDDLSESMKEYAKSVGLSTDQLKVLQATAKKNKELEEFANKTGLSANEVKRLGQEAEKTKDKLGLMGKAVAALGLGALVKGVSGHLVGLAREAEKAHLSLEFLTGSKEAAKEAKAVFDKMASAGAFTDDEAFSAGRKLLNLKMPIDEVKTALADMGDIAKGSGMSLESLSDVYSKSKTMGVVDMRDIKQLSSQGIPIFEELAGVMGITSTNSEEMASKIKAMANDGVIKFDHLRQAFSNMSAEGGKYAGVMDKLALSSSGLATAFKNKFSQIKESLGAVLLEGLRPLLEAGVVFMDWLQGCPAAMTVFKIVVLALVPIIGVLLVGAFMGATKAAWAFAIALMANPITWIVMAVVAAVIFLILVIEDLWHAFTGGESIIADIFGGAIEKIKAAWAAIVNFFVGIKNAVVGFFVGIGTTIKGWISSFIEVVKKYGKFLIMALFPVSILFFYWDEISTFLCSLPDKIVGFFKTIPGKIRAIFSNITEFLKGLLPKWVVDIVAKFTGRSGGKTEGGKSPEGRASGGAVFAGEKYRVGENGAEDFVPRADGTIIPHHKLSDNNGSRSKSGNNINITFTCNVNAGQSDPNTIADLVIQKFRDFIPSIEGELGLEVG